ncbi:conjugal transfer protein TrbB [Mycobacterium sp. SMC-8]|uniref:conjugal transfer protein TrbB n=1 Tax=Mycobacterium sp. SMC-8 TaxID=2857060 RepID=UPI0021B2C919|nr:conjugal transfer protein TrbB [Mycobacterium sp. SMC-8]
MARDRTGRRRLAEVGVLRRRDDGIVEVLTGWHADTGFGPAADTLHDLVQGGSRT